MPGLLGIISKTNKPVPQKSLDRMIISLQHEPDYIINRFAFHENHFLIANISINSNDNSIQYFKDSLSKDSCIIWGKIFNYEELRQELAQKKIVLHGTSDAELLLSLYNQFGDSFLSKLNGWFNLLIFSPSHNKLIIANDRFGLLPLYYYQNDKYFFFAPEIKAIIGDSAVEKKIRIQSFCEYMQYECIFDDKTYFENIFRLPPSTMLIFRHDKLEKHKYWTWEEYLQLPALSESEFLDKCNDVLEKATIRCFRNCTNAVISLTGGIDTRAIMAALPENHSIEKTITFGSHEYVPDNIISKKLSEIFGIPHTFINTSENAINIDVVNNGVYISDGMCNVFAGLDISESFKKQFKNKIVIKGQYGSQILHAQFQLKPLLNQNTWGLVKDLFNGDIDRGYNPDVSLQSIPPDVLKNDLCFMIQEEIRHHWIGYLAIQNSIADVRTPYMDSDLISLLFQCPKELNVDRVQKLFIRKYNIQLANIPTDKGVLIGKPSILSLACAIKYGTGYFLHRATTARRRLPAFLHLNKLPFSVLLNPGEIMRKNLKKDIEQVLFDENAIKRDLFNQKKVKTIFDIHMRNIKDYSRELGRILVLELFFRNFVD